ncbi:MAG: hypothetical protein ACREQ5_21165, partial [Candidatus Dormibacteria bacterium]
MAGGLKFGANGVTIGANVEPVVTLDVSNATDAIAFPVGNTAQRPANPVIGEARYNKDSYFEGFNGGSWGPLANVSAIIAPPNTAIQFNDANNFGGNANFVFDKVNIAVGIGNTNPSALGFGHKLVLQSPYSRLDLICTGNANNAGYRWQVQNTTGTVGGMGIYGVPADPINDRYVGIAADDDTYQLKVGANANTYVTGNLSVTSNIANVGNLLVTQNTTTGNLSVTSNIANTGNLLVTQNTYTGNLQVSSNTLLLGLTAANISNAIVSGVGGNPYRI